MTIDPKELQTGRTLQEILPCHVRRYRFAAEALARALPTYDARVLDVFCGNGYGTSILSDAMPFAKVVGVDRNEEALAIGHACYSRKNVELRTATWRPDFEDLVPFWAQIAIEGGITIQKGVVIGDAIPFHAIVCFETIEHLEEPGAFLEELRKMLVPKGLLFLSSPNAETLDVAEFPYHLRHYTFEELKALVVEAGFRPISVSGQIGTEFFGIQGDQHRAHHFVGLAQRRR